MEEKGESRSENLEKIRVGTALIKQLSTSFYPNPRMIFDEMVSNANDALATVVRLDIGENEIVIEDNGEGMTKEQLIRFFYISYTDKPGAPMRKTKEGIKREIIGRFGIGKLSLYQICSWFEITTWKDGIISHAEFSFDDFEKNEFIDDFSLNVSSETTGNKGSGTRLVLHKLKTSISAKNIKRDLTRTMPLRSDFRIIISGIGLDRSVELRSEDVVTGHKYQIDEFVEDVGKIKGVVIYKERTTIEDFGVYIRVFGRLVNMDNPGGIIDITNLSYAQQFQRRIYAEFNVNGLSDALLTNRAGFILNHPVYIKFQDWVKSRLNKLNRIEAERYSKLQEEKEGEMLPKAIADIFPKGKEATAIYSGFKTEKKQSSIANLTPLEKSQQDMEDGQIRDVVMQKEPCFAFGGKRIRIRIDKILNGPEGVFDRERNVIIINSEHPMYIISRSQGKTWGVLYHSLKTCILLVALEMSSNLDGFRKMYEELSRESTGVGEIKLRGRRGQG